MGGYRESRIHIVGHWNYKEDVVKPVYVVSSAEKVELFLNGKSFRKRSKRFIISCILSKMWHLFRASWKL
ncbi:DUF4982 domain-containing protein [Phocaeicola dorei]|uniref:DUF4982 domain-containing protein n=1 Tax=Phocaeicola dorei TaxID=357276 RepID=UPI003978C218